MAATETCVDDKAEARDKEGSDSGVPVIILRVAIKGF